MFTRKKQLTLERWFFLIVAAVVVYLFWKIIEPFALVVVTAGITAIVLSPLDIKLRHLLKSRKLSAAFLSLGTFLLIVIPLFFILILIGTQASELIQVSLAQGGWLRSFQMDHLALFQSLPAFAQERLMSINLETVGSGVAAWALENVGELFSSTTQLLLNTFLFFIALYYLLVDREKLYQELLTLSPFRNSVDEKILARITSTIRHVVFGALLLAIVQGVFATIGMSLFGVPGAMIWGGLTIISALVPLVGTALVLVPAIIYLFMIGQVEASVGLAVWAAIVVGASDNLLAPYFIKGRTHMHMFLVLLSVLGGFAVFGSIGFIIGPTILAAFLAVLELYKSGILHERTGLKF